MSGQIVNVLNDVRTFIPWVSFLAGFGGSLHCVGMCGGLVTATSDKSKDILRYQVGRLVGYLSLGALAGVLGRFFNLGFINPIISIIPAIFIGVLFIFWGYQNFKGRKAEIPAPRFLSNLYKLLWQKLVKKNHNFSKAFFVGLISLFLPCGLLYGVVLGTLALEHVHEVLFSMLFFWLGTVPSMVVAPGVVQRLILPFKSKLPKTFALSLMFIGIMTITLRMVKLHEMREMPSAETANQMNCH